ncbi:hypothetical protein AtDm6_2707 [Acetobacter tropicalis]|uniref:Uncharacterized protein n=1 Tax=Acetobacter tropicalis TaxID=104102 RepID=A0A094ZHB5_9PROT|nr:hypothetical protein AtDm6_2707 [Acetobacter tropicalis]
MERAALMTGKQTIDFCFEAYARLRPTVDELTKLLGPVLRRSFAVTHGEGCFMPDEPREQT